jgi:hypothetical protein
MESPAPEKMTLQEKLLSAAGLAVLAGIVVLAFSAYLGPNMLIDFAIRLCS